MDLLLEIKKSVDQVREKQTVAVAKSSWPTLNSVMID